MCVTWQALQQGTLVSTARLASRVSERQSKLLSTATVTTAFKSSAAVSSGVFAAADCARELKSERVSAVTQSAAASKGDLQPQRPSIVTRQASCAPELNNCNNRERLPASRLAGRGIAAVSCAAAAGSHGAGPGERVRAALLPHPADVPADAEGPELPHLPGGLPPPHMIGLLAAMQGCSSLLLACLWRLHASCHRVLTRKSTCRCRRT